MANFAIKGIMRTTRTTTVTKSHGPNLDVSVGIEVVHD